jgi:hypothetical protein
VSKGIVLALVRRYIKVLEERGTSLESKKEILIEKI